MNAFTDAIVVVPALLAGATTQPGTPRAGALATLPEHWPAQIDLLKECETMSSGIAALLIIAGLVYLLYGFQFFKWLVTLNALIMGAWIGAKLGKQADAMIPCAIIGGFIAAAVTWPTMKYSVAVMGGLFGAILGASVWQTVGLDPAFAWSGACMGLILFGLLAFIIFRGSLMMYMSLQGAVMFVFGALGLIYKLKDVGPVITAKMNVAPFLLPMAIFIPAIVGIIYQQQTTAPAGGPPPKK
jgi:hypothetical protein